MGHGLSEAEKSYLRTKLQHEVASLESKVKTDRIRYAKSTPGTQDWMNRSFELMTAKANLAAIRKMLARV